MSIKDLKDSAEKGKVLFGFKQAVKLAGKKKKPRVFIASDAREETFSVLEKAGIKPEILKTKEDISKQLGLDFESEVFTLN